MQNAPAHLRGEIKSLYCADLSYAFCRSNLSASFGTPSRSLKPVRTAIYICYGSAQAVRTTSTLLQFMAVPTLFASLNHASTPPRWNVHHLTHLSHVPPMLHGSYSRW